MSLTAEERQRLWLLFQACDTDSDGLVNNEDIRMLSSRSEFSDYNPEEIVDLFATFQNDDSTYTFEDFINKKLAHHEPLSQMSETTSMSSGFTNRSTTEDSISELFDKHRFYRHRNHQYQNQYDSNLNKYKTNLILDEIDSSLSKSMNNLQLESNLNNNYHRSNLDMDMIGRRVFTAIPPSNMNNPEHKYRTNNNNNNNNLNNKFNDLKRYLKNYLLLPEGTMERSDWSEDAKKKFNLIRQDYINCLNELSDENENICEELDRTMKERNYLRDKIDMLRDEYQENLQKHREQWLCERQKLEQKINNLESYVAKLSYTPKPLSNDMTWFNSPAINNNTNAVTNNENVINENFAENFKLHQLANKISELALFLSEIISNLRKSEIDLMMANCRAVGIVKNVNHRDDDEELLQIYERAMLNRNMIEQESIDFICNLDKEILVQYLTPSEFQKIFKSNRQLTFDIEFQNILLDLLAKLKDDLRNVNKTLDLQQQIDQENCEKLNVDTYNNYLQNLNYKL